MNGARHLQTERLELRRITPRDGPWLVELDADPRVRRYVGAYPPKSLAEVEAGPLARLVGWHERSDELGFWKVVPRGPGADAATGLGWVHFRPCAWADDPFDPALEQVQELGWRFMPGAWGRGYATEAMVALADRAIRQLGVPRLCACAEPDNDASIRVMERMGMRFERQLVHPAGGDCVLYGVDAPAWKAWRASGAVGVAGVAGVVGAVGAVGAAEAVGGAEVPERTPLRVRCERTPDGVGRGRPVGDAAVAGVRWRAVLAEAGTAGPGGIPSGGSSRRNGERDVGSALARTVRAGDVTGTLIQSIEIAADVRGRCAGARLVRAILGDAHAIGHRFALVPGQGAWWRRFGFVAAGARGIGVDRSLAAPVPFFAPFPASASTRPSADGGPSRGTGAGAHSVARSADDQWLVRPLEGATLPPPGTHIVASAS
ncbi:MAG: GNAT family N-acetyltransferase [Phycisphaerales bacterium]